MGRVWRTALAGALLTTVLAGPAVADDDASSPSPSPSPKASAAAVKPVQKPAPKPAVAKPAAKPAPKPAPAPVRAAVKALPTASPSVLPSVSPSLSAQAAAKLAKLAQQQAEELQSGIDAHGAAAARATEALEVYQAAQRAADAAVRHSNGQAEQLRQAEKRTQETRERLSRYVGSLYRTGMGNRQIAMYGSLMDARNPQQLFRGLGMVARVGGNQNDHFVGLARAEAVQERVAERARKAAAAAREATAKAAAAKRAADTVVAAAVHKVAKTAAELTHTQAALQIATRREALIASAASIARQRSVIPAAAIEGAMAPRPIPECKGGIVHGFPNGRIPLPALCPLWGTSGQLLRADAAAAFDGMSKAFGAEFGEPIYVTDSYRSYEEQVAVKILKPDLAAMPGTSNHGWGVALDLCGGIQSFSTPQHEWMVVNSMAYGWFHPLWAQADGSKPEAWHWEFAG